MTQKASVTPPLFENSAKEVLTRLEGDSSQEAEDMRVEARELVAIFRKWMVERPADPIKHEVVNRLFSLYRRAMNHLLQK